MRIQGLAVVAVDIGYNGIEILPVLNPAQAPTFWYVVRNSLAFMPTRAEKTLLIWAVHKAQDFSQLFQGKKVGVERKLMVSSQSAFVQVKEGKDGGPRYRC